MTIIEIVNRLAEIKIQKNELQKQEDSLLASIKFTPSNLNGGGHVARPIGRPKGSGRKFSYYVRQKLSKQRKAAWAALAPHRKVEIIKARIAGRNKNK